jgi:hypothetical protein
MLCLDLPKMFMAIEAPRSTQAIAGCTQSEGAFHTDLYKSKVLENMSALRELMILAQLVAE